MSEAENIEIVRRFYDEVFDRQNLDLADTLVAPYFKNHTAPPEMRDGPEGIKAIVRMLFAAFPDDRHDIEDIFAAGDRVAVRQRHHGTHEGAFLGLPPSGAHVSQAEIHIIRLEGGRLVEHWGCRDDLGFLQQMRAPASELVKT
ncbi:MAG TPA: ester cyclase [Chloroflexota bacterium]|jgi:predicted ester cyclase|nr:ester cyclase [Chloroflexota bacterium]